MWSGHEGEKDAQRGISRSDPCETVEHGCSRSADGHDAASHHVRKLLTVMATTVTRAAVGTYNCMMGSGQTAIVFKIDVVAIAVVLLHVAAVVCGCTGRSDDGSGGSVADVGGGSGGVAAWRPGACDCAAVRRGG